MSDRPNAQTSDITGWKKVQLKPPNGELAVDIIDAIPDGVVMVDMDGKVTFVNKAFEDMLGYRIEELVGTSAVALPTYRGSRDRKKARETLRKVIETGSAKPIDMIALRKDGMEIPINFAASVVKDAKGNSKTLVAVMRDVTERTRMEEALRSSEEYFRALMENSLDAVTIMNEAGTIRYESPSYERLLGFKPKERVGSDLLERIHPDDTSKVAEAFAQFLQNRGGILHIEVRAQHKDGSWRAIDAIGHNLLDNPVVKGIVINLRDISDRKKAEEELRESEAKLRLYLDNSPDAIYILDAKENFLYGNVAAETTVGYSKEEILGRSFVELSLLSDEQLWKAAQLHELNLAGKPTGPQEYELTRKDGSRVFVEISTYPIGEGAKLEVIGIAHDITERKKAEEELRESEERFRAIFDNSVDGILVTDLETSSFYTWNKAMCQMLGYSLEEVRNLKVPDIHPKKDLPYVIKEMERERRGESPEGKVVPLERKDGSVFYAEVTPSLVTFAGKQYLAGIFRDISERKRAEEALKSSEERYRLVVDNANEFILVAQDGMIKFFNSKVVGLLGYAREELTFKPFIDFIHPDDQQMVAGRHMARLRGEELPSVYSFRVVDRAGNVRWVEISAVVFDWEGRPATLNFLTDITERKKAEEEKQRMEEQLLLAGRLAAVGELAAGVAHELNNPLAIIQMYSESSKERADLDNTTKKDLLIIYEQAKRASKITRSLLSFARKHEPEKSMVSVNEIIEKTLEMHSHQLSINNIEVSEELQPSLPMIMADYNQMQQVFVNIIINAEQAMLEAHDRGKLNIKTETTTGGMIKISFTDDGPGISEGNLKRIFDPFFTTKEVGKGTGLGLSICYGIVQTHGGHIYAISKMGEGATFVIEIPITSEYWEVSGIESHLA